MGNTAIQSTSYEVMMMVYCEDCKWFGIHFLSDANRNIMEHQVCLDGFDVEVSDHMCNGFVGVSDD